MAHAYTAESMLDDKTGVIEEALYMALNTLEESAIMSERLAARSRQYQHRHAVTRFEGRAREARERAEKIRRVLAGGTVDEASIAFYQGFLPEDEPGVVLHGLHDTGLRRAPRAESGDRRAVPAAQEEDVGVGSVEVVTGG